ncbi:hypothetical protein POPTR_001G178600v4 [Populus trichocarpa]|uniref:Uncharacterized protein n=1 Tax=Populus trichocarpa TaxID=3694 RepID=A0ACC0TJT7_POPTR|nr:hypothetical protein BDE02_01G161700 [Populus trichocarpa]KAI9401837.1 hypothetical protein POPTR_001G178600v4 [Populus trichocarpa]
MQLSCFLFLQPLKKSFNLIS